METQENSDITKPQSWGSKLTSVNVRTEIHDKAKANNISLKEALEFGIVFKVADKDGFDYPDNNLQKKLHKFVEMYNAKREECEALRKQLNIDDEAEDQKVAADVFGGIIKDGE